MRVAVEIGHILIGIAIALALTMAAAWAYPPARAVIWWCGTGAMIASILFGIEPLRAALRDDRNRL